MPQAEQTYATAMKHDQSDLQTSLNYAILLLKSGKRAEYRRVCKQVWEQNKDTDVLHDLDRVVWLHVLVPDAVSDYQPLIEAGQRLTKEHPDEQVHHHTLAAIAYRAGNFELAKSNFEKAQQIWNVPGHEDVSNVFRSLLAAKLGEAPDQYMLFQLHQGLQQLRDPWARLELELLLAEADREIGLPAEAPVFEIEAAPAPPAPEFVPHDP